jgi:hypothetical protein
MENLIPVILGGSWASGVNLYLTAAGLGLAHKMGWVSLPGELTILGNPFVILLAFILYGLQFVADKIPYVDSFMDMVHTFIRPTGGALMGYLATAQAEPVIQGAVTLLAGGIALSSHLTKATTRAAINSAPTGIGNSVASVTEDTAVVTVMFFIVKHPIIATFIAIALIVLSIWLLRKFFRFIKRLFKPVRKEEAVVQTAQ